MYLRSLRKPIFLSTLPARGATCAVGVVAGCHCAISIHAPREGSDKARPRVEIEIIDFYPRSPRGERHPHLCGHGVRHQISIHAPREGSDSRLLPVMPRPSKFLSTLPARGATNHLF